MAIVAVKKQEEYKLTQSFAQPFGNAILFFYIGRRTQQSDFKNCDLQWCAVYPEWRIQETDSWTDKQKNMARCSRRLSPLGRK